ncbi:hypothetical protein I2I05_21530 [Hymenobacter sp. BT683]|uniref:Lipoprotein n=1 Tax=Hymenobacter jeongseonensis TaxID=2791027 RepID=A0ABS0INN3_9BACT|nr:hypothetical protein [Hymenobacter jeongseonensis]MBF9239987.1 hypothetical protein [Hymenobacter jeongseonensis]
MMNPFLFAQRMSPWAVGLLLAASCQQQPPVQQYSEVEVVYRFHCQTTLQLTKPATIPVEIAPRFRRFPTETEANNFRFRHERLLRFVDLEADTVVRHALRADCLATPNESKEIAVLRHQVAVLSNKTDLRPPDEKGAPVRLAFSASCTPGDGRNYYYVETIVARLRYSRGDVYVVRNGAVERTVNVWMT